MLKDILVNVVTQAQRKIVRYSPEILTGISIVGSVSSVVMAVKATPKAMDLIEEEKDILIKEAKERGTDEIKLTWKDYVRVCWKLYVPSAATLATSAAAGILSNCIHEKRGAAVATALAISQETFRTYQNEVIEQIGKKKEQKIQDDVAKKQMEKTPKDESKVILTGKGDYLFYDTFSGRYFRSSIPEIKRAENELNAIINRDMYASVNDFYDLLDIPGLGGILAGDTLGWSGGLVNIKYSSQISDTEHNEEPCIIISFDNFSPFENYQKAFK